MNKLTGKTQFIKEAEKCTEKNPSGGYTSFNFKPDINESVLSGPHPVIPAGTRWFHLYFTSTDDRKQQYRSLTVFGEFRAIDTETFIFEIRNRSSVHKSAEFTSGTAKVITGQLEKLYEWQQGLGAGKPLLTELCWHEEREICECEYESLQEYADVQLEGSIYVVYSFDFFSYIAEGERKNVRKLFVDYDRGDPEDLLGKLDLGGFPISLDDVDGEGPASPNETAGDGGRSKPLIDISEREKELINDGDKFSIFRNRLKRRWLIEKTYKLDMDDGQESYKVCLLKAGLIEVRKKILLYDKERDSLLGVLRGMLRHRTINSTTGVPATTIGVTGIVDAFASHVKKEVNKKLKGQGANRTAEFLDETPIDEKAAARANRENYVIILLSNIICSKCDKTIPAVKIHKNQNLIAAFLQGSLIFDEESPRLQIPSTPVRLKRRIVDQSTWSDELCVFGGERCLIYFQPKTLLESPRYVANYEDYWRCVVRGIEHTISVRATLQILESYTHALVGRIPDLMKAILPLKADEKSEFKPEDLNHKLLGLADDVAYAIEILPKLRDVCVPSSAFRSGHTIEKFTFLNETCFHFSAILGNIQQNIDELTSFLLFFKQQQMQMAFDVENKKKEERDGALGTIALIFTGATVFYVFPSFLYDFSEFWRNHCFWEGHCGTNADLIAGFGIVLYFVASVVVLVLGAGLLFRRRLRASWEGLKNRRSGKKDPKPADSSEKDGSRIG